MHNIVKIEVYLTKTADGSPFTVTIEAPQQDAASGDYYCRVISSPADAFRLDVYGILPQQAVRLALEVTAARIANIISSAEAEDADAGANGG